MIMGTDDTPRNNAESETKDIPAEDEGKGKNKIEFDEEAIRENPDLEDPRLFSPLQEPSAPAPHERITEEESDSKNNST
jgi:hypothetical protein